MFLLIANHGKTTTINAFELVLLKKICYLSALIHAHVLTLSLRKRQSQKKQKVARMYTFSNNWQAKPEIIPVPHTTQQSRNKLLGRCYKDDLALYWMCLIEINDILSFSLFASLFCECTHCSGIFCVQALLQPAAKNSTTNWGKIEIERKSRNTQTLMNKMRFKERVNNCIVWNITSDILSSHRLITNCVRSALQTLNFRAPKSK